MLSPDLFTCLLNFDRKINPANECWKQVTSLFIVSVLLMISNKAEESIVKGLFDVGMHALLPQSCCPLSAEAPVRPALVLIRLLHWLLIQAQPARVVSESCVYCNKNSVR